jgi:hypothetical protein
VAVEGHDHKEGSMKLHGSAALSQRQRRRLVELVASGTTIAAAAALVGCSRQTGSKWVGRARRGEGLEDRSSRPHRQPRERRRRSSGRCCGPAGELRLGPHPLGWALGLAASTVHAILSRNGCSRLRERPDRGEIVRYERERPGELVHVDVKKLGRIVKPSHRVRHCGGCATPLSWTVNPEYAPRRSELAKLSLDPQRLLFADISRGNLARCPLICLCD